MRRPAAWARDGGPDVVDTAAAKLREDVAAERLHVRGIGALPVNREAASFELTAERRALSGSRPTSRRWRALDKFDQELARAHERHADALRMLQEAEEQVRRAPEDDAASLADWLANGEKGERPVASLYERERERDAARLLVAALERETDTLLDKRRAHIEKHRRRMLEDARKDLDGAREALLVKVAELPALRQQLADARETLTWLAAFPDQPASYGFPSAVAFSPRFRRWQGISPRVAARLV